MPTRTVFLECMKANPLALARNGSNPGAHALAVRSAPEIKTPETKSSETDDMSTLNAFRALVAMDDVTREYSQGLDDAALETFIARTAAEQKEEAHAAKRAVDDAAAAEVARTTGKTERETELERQIAELRTQNVARAAKDAERDMRDVARSADFKGFPGGEDAVVERLKGMSGMNEATRAIFMNDMKAQAAGARRTSTIFGDTTATDVNRTEADAARARVDTAAKTMATERSIPFADAYEQVIESRDFANDVAIISQVN